jgi:Glycosyl transferase family 2
VSAHRQSSTHHRKCSPPPAVSRALALDLLNRLRPASAPPLRVAPGRRRSALRRPLPPGDGLDEEREHALRQQRCRLVVVLGEIMLGAGIDEELRSGHGRGEPSRELRSPRRPPGSFVATRTWGLERACNIGAARGNARYISFLNSDTVARRGSVDRLLEALAADGCRVAAGWSRGELGHRRDAGRLRASCVSDGVGPNLPFWSDLTASGPQIQSHVFN